MTVYDSSGTATGTVLRSSAINELVGLGTDNNNNVFVSGFDVSGAVHVVEFPGGVMPGTVLSGVKLGLPGSPQFDSSNNLIISDWAYIELNVYAPPYTALTKAISMQGDAIWCPLSHSERRIFCADYANGVIDVYTYPFNASGSSYLYSYSAGLSTGLDVVGSATSPAAPL